MPRGRMTSYSIGHDAHTGSIDRGLQLRILEHIQGTVDAT